MFEGWGLMLEQRCFPLLEIRRYLQKCWEPPGWLVAGAALPPPTASAGRSHPIITMTYSRGLCKYKEEDAGPPVCLFLLSEQDLVRLQCDVALTTALSSKQRGVQETHRCPPTHGMGTARPQNRPGPTTGKGPAKAHLQPLHTTTAQGSWATSVAVSQWTCCGSANLRHPAFGE